MNHLIFIFLDTGMVAGIVTGIVILIPLVFILICYFFLADKNIFFTFGHENKAMHVLLGKKFSGRVIFPSHTNYIERRTYDFKPYTNQLPYTRGQSSILGMQWVGFWPFYSIYERRQQWQEWKLVEQGTGPERKSVLQLVLRNEMTPFLIAKPFAYGMLLSAAENKENIPLDIAFTIFLEPTNAYKPIFGNDDAYGQVQSVALAAALLYVRVETFASLESAKDLKSLSDQQKEHDDFAKFMCSLNTQLPGRPVDNTGVQGLIELYGYRIRGAAINGVDITGQNKQIIIDATTKKYVAEQEKEATILQAEGESKAKMLNTDATKYDMEIRTNFYANIKEMPHAQQIELAIEMFKNSKLTTFVSGKEVTPTIPLTK